MATVAKEPVASEKKQRPSALRSVIAGSTAGAIEIGKFVFAALRRATMSRTCLDLKIFELELTTFADDSHYLPCRVYV
jgi:hypothetical protein